MQPCVDCSKVLQHFAAGPIDWDTSDRKSNGSAAKKKAKRQAASAALAAKKAGGTVRPRAVIVKRQIPLRGGGARTRPGIGVSPGYDVMLQIPSAAAAALIGGSPLSPKNEASGDPFALLLNAIERGPRTIETG